MRDKTRSGWFVMVLLSIIFSCNSHENITFTESELNIIETPSKVGGEPNLYVSPSDHVYLSWVEYADDTTDVLLFSKLQDNVWSKPKEIARGGNWFVNWADFPSLIAFGSNDQEMMAHWLQKSAAGTFDYDVRISLSHDGGETWEDSFVPHRDSLPSEHGFVSMVPCSDSSTMAIWLDGRKTVGEGMDDHEGGHGHHGSMTLRGAVVDVKGALSYEEELDSKICDCCQTSAVKVGDDILAAYRDRSEEEIRDISVVKWSDGQWSNPVNVSKDNWKIAGCPVNGPSLAAYNDNVALTWFTMDGEQAKVKLAFSRDSGDQFGKAIRVDDGNPMGRVDVVMPSEKKAIVSYIERNDEGAVFKIKSIDHQGVIDHEMTISDFDASRSSGFPRMVRSSDQLIFAWTAVDSSTTSVTSAILNMMP
ncbi:hypothetical protein [Portibacter marinus]|uniref:hypothetical protein n=1 Tax=Portibacter marinus TaxID=2898660 RepID=UPI001F42E3B2|nr:hypothetical protein [Portibacter marinus]